MTKRVVSLTPVAIERDSRTYKHAASLARMGYESIVVEGQPSTGLTPPLPFRLLTKPSAATSAEEALRDVAADPQPISPAVKERGDLVRSARYLLVSAPARMRYRMARFHQQHLPFQYLRWYARESRETAAVVPDAAVYYLHSYRQFPAVARRSRDIGAALIYDAHDSYGDLRPHPIRGVHGALALVEGRCVRAAAVRTTSSEGMARRLEDRFGREFRVVRNCDDVRLAETLSSDVRSDAGISDDAFLTVMVANNKDGLAFARGLEAIKGLEDRFHLAFVGMGYERETALATAAGLEKRIHFLPPVPPMTISAYIGTADAAALLYAPVTVNYMITLPNGLFHAVGAGLPLIYPAFGEMRALAERHRLGIGVDPEDAGGVRAAMLELGTNPELAHGYRESVRRAGSTLSWEREESVIAEVVAEALAG